MSGRIIAEDRSGIRELEERAGNLTTLLENAEEQLIPLSGGAGYFLVKRRGVSAEEFIRRLEEALADWVEHGRLPERF